MSTLRPLIPLLITAGILLGGNGLQGTLIAMRGALEGFQPSTIGLRAVAATFSTDSFRADLRSYLGCEPPPRA